MTGGELVLDQPIRGRRIGYAQKRLGEHHQRQALFGGERKRVQEILDATQAADLGADRPDQAPRARINPAFRGAIARHVRQKFGRQFFVVWRKWRLERRQRSRHSVHAGILSCPQIKRDDRMWIVRTAS